ncbi:hypothetical protein phiP47_010 [Plesiomonas phage phiP4-7]|nr:hypothetical protein phiP47_010 [Plesiomonas phage phiP4-7]
MERGIKPSEKEISRLTKSKEIAINQGHAIAYIKNDSDNGGVIYIHPFTDVEELRKSLIQLATQIQ